MPLRVLHLSDIHFTTKRNDERIVHDDVRDQLLNDLTNEVIPQLGRIDLVLIAGDIAFSGKAAEFELAAQWLEKVTAICGCRTIDVLPVPGNHDVDRSRIAATTRMIHERLRGCSTPEAAQRLVDLAETKDGFLVDKLQDYQAFAASYGCQFKSNSKPFWERSFDLNSSLKLNFIGLTSVQVCDADDTEGSLLLGKHQYVISRNSQVENVVIMHHPYDWLKDKKEAEQYISARARVLITGHEHVQEVSQVTNIGGHDRLVIASGAVTPDHAADPYIYRYNVLEFEAITSDAGVGLRVTVHPRIWTRQDTEFTADRNRLHGQISAPFDLRCPQFNLAPGLATAAPAAVPPAADEEGFARLSYYFWRYLTWQQRLGVLVGIECLPAMADRPADRSIEQLGLLRARQEQRLRNLWERIMQTIPAGSREPNPFP